MKETVMIPKHQTSYHKKRRILRARGWMEVHCRGDFTQFDKEFETEQDRDKDFEELKNEGLMFGDAVEAKPASETIKPYKQTLRETFGIGHLPCPICRFPVSECRCSGEIRKFRFGN